MEHIKYYDIEKQRSHKAGFKEVLGSSKLFIGLVLIALIGCNFYLSSIEIQAWYEVHTKVLFGIFSFFVGFHLLIMLSIKSSKNDKENKNVALTNQEDKDTYFIKIGQEVKEHKGDIKESSNKENIVKDLLIKEKNYCTHWAIMGTTASGKTVFMQNMQKEILRVGGGFMFIDGKGSQPMIKDIKSLCWQFNRQNDFHLINFNNPKKSNSINLFKLDYTQLQEVFNFILPKSEGGDEWRTKAITLSSALLFFICSLQRLKIAIDTNNLSKINNYEDLKKYSPKSMNFNLFNQMLDSKALIDICKMFSRVYKNSQEFEAIFEKASNQEASEIKNKAHEALLSWVSQQINKPQEDILTKEFKELDKEDTFYSVGVAIGYFSEPLNKFTIQYGPIFNRSDYDIDIEDIVLNHKILYVALPGTKSQETSSMLAKIILGNIVAMYETLKERKPLNTPYTVFFDEINSYGKDIGGLGNLLSQTREQKLVFVLGFQSDLMKLDSGKGLESEQLFANINNIVVLKLKSPKLVKDLQELMPKKRVLIDKQTYYVGGDTGKEKMGGDKENYEMKETPYFQTEEIEALNQGECYIKIAEKVYKGIGAYIELPNYLKEDYTQEVKLLQKMSK